MEFTIEFYKSSTGKCQVRDFLDVLKKTDPYDFAAVMAGLAKLRNRDYHWPPLSKSIGNDLLELRHAGKLNTRIIYFFMKGQRIILVHGIRNKAMKIPAQDLTVSLQRKTDWLARSQ